MTRALLPPPMTTPDICRIFKILGAGQVRFVGGCVRNAVLGIGIGDIDLATTHVPDDVVRLLNAEGIKVVPTGVDHGTVTAVLHGGGYEITTLRRDVATDGRRAVVAFTTDWAEDAARRDFTMNALYADLDGKIYDPLGRGLRDLEKRKVIFVGDAATRIQEDYLRILRFFRFHSLYGKGAMDKKGLAAAAAFAPKIKTLSRERITQELTKILMGDNPTKILSLMQEHKILPDIIGKSFHPNRFASLLKIQKKADGAGHDVLFCSRLFIALGGRFKNTGKIDNLLILNKKQIRLLENISGIKMDTQRVDVLDIAKNFYRYDRPSVAAAMMVAAAQDGVSPTQFQKIWTCLAATPTPVFPLSGKDLMALGHPHGPALGAILSRLEQKWVRSGFSLSRQALLANA